MPLFLSWERKRGVRGVFVTQMLVKSKYSLRRDLFIAICRPANSSGKLLRSVSQRRLESNESHLWRSSLMKCSLKVFFFLLLVPLIPLRSLFLYIFGMSREWSPAKQKICRLRFRVRDGVSRVWGCGDKKRWQSRLEVAATHKDGFYAANFPGRSHKVGWRGTASEILLVSRSRAISRGARDAFIQTGSFWVTLFIQTLLLSSENTLKKRLVMLDPVVQVWKWFYLTFSSRNLMQLGFAL